MSLTNVHSPSAHLGLCCLMNKDIGQSRFLVPILTYNPFPKYFAMYFASIGLSPICLHLISALFSNGASAFVQARR